MKRISLILSLALTAMPFSYAADAAPDAQQQSQPQQGGSESMGSAPLSETVKGQVKETLDIQKPAPTIELDVKEIVESGTAQTDKVLQEAKAIPSQEDFDNYGKLSSNQVLHPWLPLIPEPPLVTFYPGLSKLASKHWEFRVSDQSGEVVKLIKGNGVPPREIDWNGLNERGQYITVGTLYSYQFVTYDEHENANTFPGEPFQLDALMYKQSGKLVVEFANKRLFMDDQATFRPAMKNMWDRAVDVVRENSNKPLTIEVYADSVRSTVAEDRRQAAVNSISDATNIPAVDIRHKIDKISDRGDVIRLVMNSK